MVATTARVVALGEESSWGTAVAATARLMGLMQADFKIDDTTEVLPDLGRFSPSPNAIQLMLSASGTVSTYGTYEDTPYILDGIFGEATPSGSNPYVYAYTAPIATAATPKPYSIEYGASGASYVMAGGLMKTLRISGAAGRYWEVSTDIIGKSIATVSLASLSDRTIEPIRMSDTVLHIDAVGGTIGTTSVSTLISFELNVDTKRHLKTYAGNLAPTGKGEDKWTGSLKLVLEFDSTSKAYVDALLSAKVQKQIQIKATSGSKIATLQFAGTLIGGVPLFSDREGNVTVELNFDGQYNSTLGNWLKASFTNAVSALA